MILFIAGHRRHVCYVIGLNIDVMRRINVNLCILVLV